MPVASLLLRNSCKQPGCYFLLIVFSNLISSRGWQLDPVQIGFHELLEKTYAVRRKSFIATDNFGTFWTDEKKCNRYHFSCRDLCRAIDFLIDNIFVRFGGKVFRQVIGIPMGTNSAPLLADLFLHTYEYEFIIKTMKGDITRALQFNKTFRYIDDLLCVNNDNFNKHINEIYPSELILKNTTTTPSETSYLDTTLNIGSGGFRGGAQGARAPPFGGIFAKDL